MPVQTEKQRLSTQAAEEARWKAERDASTVAEAAAIRSDPQRLAAAKVEAKRMASEEQQRASEATARAKSMGNLAKEKKVSNPKPKTKPKAKPKTPKPKAKPRTKPSPKAKPKSYSKKPASSKPRAKKKR